MQAGDCIVAFDGYPAVDELDFLFYSEKETFSMTVRDKNSGEEVAVDVEKDADEPLGLTFETVGEPCLRTCHNRCIFCFVDQMPKGMRESLYVKDDDYAMSFTCGNFVTLTNLFADGLERIIRLKLSPLYVSVHTMNPALRVELLRNRFAGKIVEQIDALAKGGIELHCQAVVVPDKNDGEELAYTARKLFAYYPQVKELAVVPTGLTKFRDGLTEIPDVDGAYCERFLARVDELNAEFGVHFIQPADEYFVRAGRAFPPAAFYGDFEQIENGVGMTVKFLGEVEEGLSALRKNYALKTPKKSLLVCGVSAEKINGEVGKLAERAIENLTVKTLAVENGFFGSTVTCTGLLTGTDMLKAVQKRLQTEPFDEVILAGNTMKEFEDVFLCGMTLAEFSAGVAPYGATVKVNRDGGNGLVQILSKQ